MLGSIKKLFCGKVAHGSVINATAHIVRQSKGEAVMDIAGNWLVGQKSTSLKKIERDLSSGISSLSFTTKKLGKYDSTLVSMLFKCHNFCRQYGISFKIDTLPQGLCELLKLAVAVPEADSAKKIGYNTHNIVRMLGERTLGFLDSCTMYAGFIGDLTITFSKAIFGKARFRMYDLLTLMQRTGPEALPIVALISFLVGLILAFVGAIQLAKYGSEIFVADLVGIAMVREMGAIMVGVVMSGRTGAAFAAELGSMKVNEEISAFKTFGISPIEFLVYPRVLALILMFPLLTVFADVIGMLGGMAIGIGMFDIGYEQYMNRTLAALDIVQISTGIGKSLVFGAIVAVIGCQKGLSAENSSLGVGRATTASVVQSITWIIVADAIFAVAFAIFDI